MKIYKKVHDDKKVANLHIAKIKQRGGKVKKTLQGGKVLLEYSFDDNTEKDIRDMIELYDDNYNVYRRRYLQTESDDDKLKMNKYLKMRKEQEDLLK